MKRFILKDKDKPSNCLKLDAVFDKKFNSKWIGMYGRSEYQENDLLMQINPKQIPSLINWLKDAETYLEEQ